MNFNLPQFRSSLLAPRASRRGLTLIELLVVMLIISMLAALVLGVAAVAGETAREQHSKHVVQRLHTLLMDYYGNFKTRRVRLRTDDPNTQNGIETQIKKAFPNPNDAPKLGQALAEARLYAMREMILMEVPDRWSDVLLNDIGPSTGPPSNIERAPLYLEGRTELSSAYLRRYRSLIGRTNTITNAANTAEDLRANQGAECLYMVITMACGDGEARTLFGENSIGDLDGDGAPEFVDGWKLPINFLRWAPGFESQIQLDAYQLDPDGLNAAEFSNPPPAWSQAAASDHDPSDLFRRDLVAYRLIPLIYSPGRDETSGLYSKPAFVTWRLNGSPTLSFRRQTPFIDSPILTPYLLGSPNHPDAYLGTSMHKVDPANNDETSTDNVHNHLLGKR
jgi:prepilin-type N-terminal cleavage/methylation domain-containing protein